MQSVLRSTRILPQLSCRILCNTIRMDSTSSISAKLKTDHQDINTAYQKYLSAEGNISEQQRWANEFRWELARHTVGEELVVYPAFEKKLGAEGKRIADADRAHHQEVKSLLHLLETSSVTDSHYRSTFDKLMKKFTAHVKGEEEKHLANFEKAISPEESASLARSFERTKMFAPTRAHPNAPNKPPFETVAGLLTAPLDKLRDLFEKFPEKK
ncbi:unnamed protein product [Rotaria sp. Silwood2]|nr:unnamed protein product [Rotaria sp. Silwood2]CAF2951491.1 unnamed protein product [Rotaria sp. Silwood2]CAF4408183.1 unnamed protein product [Rotaria sp. Silwood2]CAF4440243.1 unnamed protein product [Rotaria sp. Silwood2]